MVVVQAISDKKRIKHVKHVADCTRSTPEGSQDYPKGDPPKREKKRHMQRRINSMFRNTSQPLAPNKLCKRKIKKKKKKKINQKVSYPPGDMYNARPEVDLAHNAAAIS
jgi:hypothetical protein